MRPLSAIVLAAIFLLPFTTQAQHPLQQFLTDWQPNPAIPPNGAEESLEGFGDPGFISWFTRGAGVTVGDTMTNAYIGSGWTDPSLAAAEANNRYFTFETGGGPGVFVIACRQFAVYHIRSATGPAWYQWQYSLDSFRTAGKPIGDSIQFTAQAPPRQQTAGPALVKGSSTPSP